MGATTLDDIDFFVDNMVQEGARDQFPAMTNLTPVRPEEVSYVADHERVLGVYLEGEARAHPENLGWVHEIINDELGGRFVCESYCPLTGSGQNLEATTSDGKQVEYGVSGCLLNSNLVIFDLDDNTLFPQMASTGLNGFRAGDQLKQLPVVETTWSFWKRLYPETTVPKGGTGPTASPWAPPVGNTRPITTTSPFRRRAHSIIDWDQGYRDGDLSE